MKLQNARLTNCLYDMGRGSRVDSIEADYDYYSKLLLEEDCKICDEGLIIDGIKIILSEEV
jgi:hypothetical protein